MKYRNLQILRLASSIILLTIIALVLLAYFRMDSYFNKLENATLSVDFQLFVWGIILLSTASFFINWRLILTSTANKADKNDVLDNDILTKNTDNIENDFKEYSFDYSFLFNNKDIEPSSDEFIKQAITVLCRELELDLAVSFKLNESNKFQNWINYALFAEEKPDSFDFGDGLHGQVALEMKAMHIKDIPDNYLKITSGSGSILPKNVYIIPIIKNDKTNIIIEFADMKTKENNIFDILKSFANEYSNLLKE